MWLFTGPTYENGSLLNLLKHGLQHHTRMRTRMQKRMWTRTRILWRIVQCSSFHILTCLLLNYPLPLPYRCRIWMNWSTTSDHPHCPLPCPCPCPCPCQGLGGCTWTLWSTTCYRGVWQSSRQVYCLSLVEYGEVKGI